MILYIYTVVVLHSNWTGQASGVCGLQFENTDYLNDGPNAAVANCAAED